METGQPWTRFGKVVKDLRTEHKLTQAELAIASGVDQTTISLLERGQRQPTLRTLYGLSAALDLRLVELIGLLEDDSGDVEAD